MVPSGRISIFSIHRRRCCCAPRLAAFFHYSERQVQRLIRKLTGKTYVENIQDIRMRHAARMITAGKRTITEIAQDLGYSDQANFRAVYRRYYGMNPAQYRKKSSEICP